MVDGHASRQHDADPVPGRQPLAGEGPDQQQQADGVAAHDRQHVVTAEGDGRGADADLQVVVAVDHGVFGVIGHRPEDVGQQHDPGRQRDGIGQCGKAHRDTETEGNAQIGLGNGEETLEERVAARQHGRHHGQPPDQRPEGKDQGKCQQAEHHEDGHGLPGRNGLAGQRPVDGASHFAVEVAVGEVVDGAAGRTHQHGAQTESEQGISWRPAMAGHEQRP